LSEASVKELDQVVRVVRARVWLVDSDHEGSFWRRSRSHR